ncbi:potassium voltage-gated channel protein shk-1-like [Mytilus californianus]|uniref:potassium voltage-gated channel protein shk-1-like n=1 Tax=Mytilus californianus TaxID=6549 RepID=UPI00224692A5|nr:potassium voltage-gated channel protein shk-1-like [Mytilus californianus]
MPKWWYQLDRALMGYFTVEFIVRFIACPSKQTFAKCWLNILDFVLNMSMWTRFGIEQLNHEKMLTTSNSVIIWVWGLSYCMVSLRILRFLRVNRQYFELRVLLLTLKQSSKELLLLFVSFILLAALFANFIFYAEYEDPTAFPSTFSGLWWSVVTMTTVGYGDTVPKSILGKVIGGACAMCGLLVIAMPITIVASKFNDNYRKMKDIVKFKLKISVKKIANIRSCIRK